MSPTTPDSPAPWEPTPHTFDEYAAGTVPFRYIIDEDGNPQLMVLLVHRTKWKDVSFPKGKLDPGETLPQAAARETLEETGIGVTLGVNLGTISSHSRVAQRK